MYRFRLAFLMGSVLLVAACGGGGGSGGGSGGSGGGNASGITSVAVACLPNTLISDQTSTCSAAVSGTGNFSSAVTWSASMGSIDASGLFTAPQVMGITPIAITATSTQDSTKSGVATVTVNPPAAGNNVLPLVVDGGPTGNYVNGLFTSVRVCAPDSTTNCQTIDHVLVDTGAVGLRLLSTAGGAGFSLSLPQQQAPNQNNPLFQCARFLDGFTWGPVVLADVYLGSKMVGSMRIQVITPAGTPSIPSSCSSAGSNQGTLERLGANGILGIGLFLQDCGDYCSQYLLNNFYYSCPSTGCVETLIPTAQQLQNPVSLFANDNNGVIIQLPAIPDTGQATVNGWLVFGIGTQPNNGLGGAVVYTTDRVGNFTTTYNNKPYPSSFIDSGSNGLFFLTPAETGLPLCSGSSAGWYCPTTEKSFTVTNTGSNGTSGTVTFEIANARTLFNSVNTAFNNLGGTNVYGTFDYGLPFFFGRNVYFAIKDRNTPGGLGPYYAY